MELNIINENKNALFKRNEVTAQVSEQVVPSKEVVREELASKLSVDKELIEILGINGKFGSQVFTVNAHIYEDNENMQATILKSKKQRDAEKKAIEDAKKAAEEEAKAAEEAAKAAEEAKNAPAEEAPVEEKAEEKTE